MKLAPKCRQRQDRRDFPSSGTPRMDLSLVIWEQIPTIYAKTRSRMSRQSNNSLCYKELGLFLRVGRESAYR